MAKRLKKYPKWLFVSERGDGDDTYLSADTEQIACIEDDGPTDVATYELISTCRLSKRVHFEGRRNEKR